MCDFYHPLSTDTPREPGEHALTRRGFLGSSVAMISAAASVPGFIDAAGAALADTTMRTSSTPGKPEDRVLVVVQLSGGNDGLNTVVPLGVDAYHRARPSLRVADDQALPIGDGVGLHPELAPVRELIGEGRAAAILGVGYPNPNRSHFQSMDIWHRGVLDARGRDQSVGWIGKALDHGIGADHPDAGLACVSLGQQTYLATQGREVAPVNFKSPELFRWAGQAVDNDMAGAYKRAVAKPQPSAEEAGARARDAEPDSAADFLRRTASDAAVASSRVRNAVKGNSEVEFPRHALGRQLQTVANMIKAGLPTRVYYVALGGFDTHAGQRGRHPNLLRQFATGVAAFQKELVRTGHDGRVVTLAFSEFGRRVKENASGGTDHGAAGPMFAFGPAVKPGALGKHPDLGQLDNGDLKHTVDFRAIYAGVLNDWMKLDAKPAVGNIRPQSIIRRSFIAA
ncbi:MAG: DUF1501 domain-containing protein [Planctomycetota bacterium]